MKTFMASQMFMRFVEEKATHPDDFRVLFFDESIIEKRNRSKYNTHKGSTPFLNDKSEEFQDTYRTPPPSNWGLEEGNIYVYDYFPSLKHDKFGVIRKPQQLAKLTEQ